MPGKNLTEQYYANKVTISGTFLGMNSVMSFWKKDFSGRKKRWGGLVLLAESPEASDHS